MESDRTHDGAGLSGELCDASAEWAHLWITFFGLGQTALGHDADELSTFKSGANFGESFFLVVFADRNAPDSP
jgi:hypothetical protein